MRLLKELTVRMKGKWREETAGSKYEYFLYLALLGIALAFPFLRISEMAVEGESLQWRFIFERWLDILPFVVLLVLHTVLLIPLLLVKGRPWRYALFTVLLICAFALFTNLQFRYKISRLPMFAQTEEGQVVRPPQVPVPPVGMRLGPPPAFVAPPGNGRFENPPVKMSLRGPVFINTFFAIMLLGCNLAIRLMFKHYRDMRTMEQLEKTRLSPHFFMNSLNNIHGMVEMNPQKAQEMILELSGMMRYVLYESSSSRISLAKEVAFLSNYVALMKVRYAPSTVSIKLDLPDSFCSAGIFVPPLLFINFIENAFKHGVDCRGKSFVDVSLRIENGSVVFRCVNSNYREDGETDKFGIGLANVRKRLDMVYPGRYTLAIADEKDVFDITLIVPAENGNKMLGNG